MLNKNVQENTSLLPSSDELSDEAGQGYRSFRRYPRQSTYCSFQEGRDVESAEVLSTSLLVGEHHNENLGLFLMLLSAIGFSLNGLTVKISGHYFPASVIVLARSIIQAIFGIIACLFLRIPPLGPVHRRRLLASRGIFGAVGLALYYYALTVLPIADATVLFLTGPVFTSILAHLWLGEDFNYLDALTSLLCFAGVILTARPPFLFGVSQPTHSPTVVDQTIGATDVPFWVLYFPPALM
ncbi:hypothetical protein DSO57_1019308 [Entomophthora muscae]|uniref:Uncharacterized protein n=1 Tax=Entomophthora muscae TaxID=34485 RepID=A0ACC2RV70_9FUNG|nr:hypothetical protein DSO57_1019308 [Entomophthora muscae]